MAGAGRSSRTDGARFRIGSGLCGYIALERRESPIAGLTQAESEVVRLVLAGHSNGEIARRRGTSTRTVGNQLSAIFKKLGLSSRLELVRFAAERPGPERAR